LKKNEVVAEMIETLIKSMPEQEEHLCIIIDSLDGLILRSDLKKNIFGDGKESVKVAGVPLLTKLLFRRLALPLDAYNGFLIITSQYSAEIKLDPYSPHIPKSIGDAAGRRVYRQLRRSYT